jgi:hypothetical protein
MQLTPDFEHRVSLNLDLKLIIHPRLALLPLLR